MNLVSQNPEETSMKIRFVFAWVMAPLALGLCGFTQDLKVKNAAEALSAAVSYLRQNHARNAPDGRIQWQEKTIYSGGPVDLATTSKQFTSDSWLAEVSQGLAPLRNIVYQVTIFSPKVGWYWSARVKADGSITEASAFRQMAEEEKQKMTQEFIKKGEVLPPQGGYGH